MFYCKMLFMIFNWRPENRGYSNLRVSVSSKDQVLILQCKYRLHGINVIKEHPLRQARFLNKIFVVQIPLLSLTCFVLLAMI